MKYEFRNIEDDYQVTVATDAVSLPDMLRHFEQFLRGCGFVFDGHIEIVNDDDAL